ncbi:MAG TPA: ATP synthase F1 subunit gamma [Bacteroidales bacterium]|nr:ATP synthase F1 subunit gamma [Bacteroidales bacterium]HOH22046.1 ATP synthase F1 subunit gamma [Bacteroidales bacterium]HPZ03329.1 ATP synthase F1 subunit gamma [Bacteroidales bacterium]HQB75092.1 ATP synthase F1 subunit gamma [Bacteroidales bacterium]
MASLKEIRNRIGSVQSTQKITGAMKLVSAAKLRRAQNSIIGLRPYSNKLNEILSNISSSIPNKSEMPLFMQRDPNKILLIVITSNRGLCGSFNSSITKETQRYIEENYPEQLGNENIDLICIGKKGKEQLEKKYNVVGHYETFIEKTQFHPIAEFAETLMDYYINRDYDRIEIIYNRFVNPAVQKIEIEQYLPIEEESVEENQNTLGIDYIYEPSRAELLELLVPKILKTQLFKTILDSVASEHGARMTAMSKATDNAIELLRDLKLAYNNARQAAITNELNEIVSGAEALKG